MADRFNPKKTPEEEAINAKRGGILGSTQLPPQQQVPRTALPGLKDRGKWGRRPVVMEKPSGKLVKDASGNFTYQNVPATESPAPIGNNAGVGESANDADLARRLNDPLRRNEALAELRLRYAPKETPAPIGNNAGVGERVGPMSSAQPVGLDGLGLASPLFIMVPEQYRDTVASSAKAIPTSTAPAVATAVAPKGPMTNILSSKPIGDMQKKYLQGLGLREKYNTGATPQDRAGVLSEIWRLGGIPVIGSGTARAPVQDFSGRGVLGTRGIDTGIVAGSKEAEERQARLDAAGRGDVYGRSDREAALARNRSGIFNRTTVDANRMARQRPPERQAGVGLTPEQAFEYKKLSSEEKRDYAKMAADERASEREAETARMAQANELLKTEMQLNNVPPKTPTEEETLRKLRTQNTLATMRESYGDPEMLKRVLNPQMYKPDEAVFPAVDMRTGQRRYATAIEISNNVDKSGRQFIVPLEEYDTEGYAIWLEKINDVRAKKAQQRKLSK